MNTLNVQPIPRLPKVVASCFIKELVRAVARTDQPAFHAALDASGDEQILRTSLSELFAWVPLIQVDYRDDYEHRYLELFWTAYQEVGLEFSPLGLVCIDESETTYLTPAQAMNALVERIRLLLHEPRG